MKISNPNYKIIISILSLLSFSAFAQIPKPASVIPTPKPTVYAIVEQVRKKYAPDKRVAIFQADLDSNRIVGKTNLPLAKKDLLNRLKSNGYVLVDAIKTLPDEDDLGDKTYALVNISVANMRSQPKESAELASQTLLGTALKIFDKDRYWYQVQTPDNYIGWVEGTTISRISKADLDSYQSKTKLMYAKPYGFSYTKPDENAQTISDLTWGDLLIVKDTLKGFYEVIYPDNRQAFVAQNEVIHFQQWQKTTQATEQSLVGAATKMMGLPYLWGGTSWKGVDCSGFTRMIYQNNAILLPRDASQQVFAGDEVPFEQLKVGDLLFFGEKATPEKPEKVVHVGMWIGDNQFIHSSGMVRISSFDKNCSNYDSHNASRYLRSRRILGSEKGVVPLRK
ncbi:NlpC/P60 family protein [Emticicia sp. SJ17W-69]|uniref:C40 family peptidase n=1 Tax=Emticicia sp. SJ17W-69 TaxID=3421657 RepID=UPI003EB9CFA5